MSKRIGVKHIGGGAGVGSAGSLAFARSLLLSDWECENFTTWTEVDPDNKLSQTARRATWTNMLSAYEGYLYKARTLDSDFTLKLDFRLTSIDVNTDGQSPLIVGIWQITENSGRMGHGETGSYVILWIQERGTSTTKFRLYLSHADDVVIDTSVDLDVGATYYLTITKVGDVYTCKIYSDSSRTTLVDTISIDLSGEAEAGVTFNFIQTTGGLFGNFRPNEQTDGYIENLCWAV